MESLSTSQPTGVVYPSAPGVVVGGPARMEPQTYEHFPRRLSYGLGIAQVLAGCLCVVFNSVSVAFAAVYKVYSIGHGIWSGILFAVTGGAGIDASKKKTKCNIVAYLVLCIVSAIVAVAITALSIVGAKEAGNFQALLLCVGRYNETSAACHILTVEIAMESCVAASAYTALCLCIWGAVICLKTVTGCCSKPS